MLLHSWRAYCSVEPFSDSPLVGPRARDAELGGGSVLNKIHWSSFTWGASYRFCGLQLAREHPAASCMHQGLP